MDFMGIGGIELLLVLVVAFIFLGPSKMIDTARTLGKIVQEFRKTTSELGQIDLDEKPEGPIVSQGGGSQATKGKEPAPETSGEPVPYKRQQAESDAEEGKPTKEGSDAP